MIALAVLAALRLAAVDVRGGEVAPAAGETPDPIYRRGRWEFGLESVYVFVNIPNPFFALALADDNNKNPLKYQLTTQVLSARYQLTNPHGPWFLRGTMEMSANIVVSTILHGAESYYVGFAPGARYYFIQPGARLVPYVEVRGGPGQTDSRGFRYAQQQDLAFTYLLGAGLRYDVNHRWSATLAVAEQHISDAYLTHPNYGFDSLGFSLGTVWKF